MRPEDIVKPGPDVTWLQVVGVVANVKLKGLVEGEQARVGAYYQPFFQDPARGIGFAVRSRGDLAATTAEVQRALAEIDPEMQAFDVFSMSERVEKSLNPRRAPMLLSTAFGLLALLLASIGLYGVLAYHVSQRTREIGIRLALGSDARGILRLVLNEGVLLVALGIAGGVVGALALRGVIASAAVRRRCARPDGHVDRRCRPRARLSHRLPWAGPPRGACQPARRAVGAVAMRGRTSFSAEPITPAGVHLLGMAQAASVMSIRAAGHESHCSTSNEASCPGPGPTTGVWR